MQLFRYLVCLLLLLSSSTMFSQQRSIKSAFSIARQHHKNVSVSCIEVQSSKNTNNSPYYIFNDSVEQSFVVVSGDERMVPVLCDVRHRLFSEKEIPSALMEMLNVYKSQYEALDSLLPLSAVSPQPLASESDVAPILHSKWGQDRPYNLLCPSNSVTGCVATAMAQIMNHWKYPLRGKGYYSYASSTRKHRCSFDFENTTFDWDNIRNEYNGWTPADNSGKAVSTLMYACGVSVNMDYDKSSGAYSVDVPYAMRTYFAYNDNVNHHFRMFYKATEWYEMVYNQLVNGCPVLYCGVDSRSGGHAFVIDGYRQRDGLFHVNWGWDGDYDAYFALDALNPNRYKFNSSQTMVVNITPETTGEHEDLFFADKFTHKEAIKLNSTINFSLEECLCGANTTSYTNNARFSGIVGVGIFDSQLRFVKSLAYKTVQNLKSYDSFPMNFSVKILNSDFKEKGIYYIAPFAQSLTADSPTRIRTMGGLTDFYKIEVSDNEVVDDNPDTDSEDSFEAIWSESFNDFGIAKIWEQELVQKAVEWTSVHVMQGDDTSKSPQPVHGSGYACLKYSDNMDFANERAVTKLITPYIRTSANGNYVLSFYCRSYDGGKKASDILTIYLLEEGKEWEQIYESEVSNTMYWSNWRIPFTAKGKIKIAIEGSLENGNSIFIDDVQLIVSETDGIDGVTRSKANVDSSQWYDLAGRRIIHHRPGVYVMPVGGKMQKVWKGYR